MWAVKLYSLALDIAQAKSSEIAFVFLKEEKICYKMVCYTCTKLLKSLYHRD